MGNPAATDIKEDMNKNEFENIKVGDLIRIRDTRFHFDPHSYVVAQVWTVNKDHLRVIKMKEIAGRESSWTAFSTLDTLIVITVSMDGVVSLWNDEIEAREMLARDEWIQQELARIQEQNAYVELRSATVRANRLAAISQMTALTPNVILPSWVKGDDPRGEGVVRLEALQQMLADAYRAGFEDSSQP